MKQLKKSKSKVENEINILAVNKNLVKSDKNLLIGIDQISNGKASESTIHQSPKLFRTEPENLLKN